MVWLDGGGIVMVVVVVTLVMAMVDVMLILAVQRYYFRCHSLKFIKIQDMSFVISSWRFRSHPITRHVFMSVIFFPRRCKDVIIHNFSK